MKLIIWLYLRKEIQNVHWDNLWTWKCWYLQVLHFKQEVYSIRFETLFLISFGVHRQAYIWGLNEHFLKRGCFNCSKLNREVYNKLDSAAKNQFFNSNELLWIFGCFDDVKANFYWASFRHFLLLVKKRFIKIMFLVNGYEKDTNTKLSTSLPFSI